MAWLALKMRDCLEASEADQAPSVLIQSIHDCIKNHYIIPDYIQADMASTIA